MEKIPSLQEVIPANLSQHARHDLSLELRALVDRGNPFSLKVTRGKKEIKVENLLTDSERLLLFSYYSTGFGINQTARILQCTHTNVWQRLYGTAKPLEPPTKGILGKLREYYRSQDLELAE